ncbi:LacI family DNA-binding transcriptional regulator [Naasia sp. SYSU D00948]|uniref:LacI family DNA-binding transcriptional regulator n=1 Tax=Naasia sp. SYSU D00948 TaxID=2817379 RepID=UPI001B30051E|nr:LacI family DNA-binding transcriptional regulator [Naasia sp. SYSU D00948]
MIGIDDVARAVGVSPATVSRALSGRGPVSEATRQQVLEAARELGYVVSSNASGLASGRTRAVGVIVPFLNRWFYAQVLEAAQNALLAAGYDLTLYNLGGGVDTRRSVFEQFLFRQRVDGLIAISLEVTTEEVRRLHEIGKPIVCVGGPIPGLRTLSIDDIEISRIATDHLTALGHRRIAHIAGGGGGYDFHLPLNRRVGYELALRNAGIEPDPGLVEPADFTIAGGHAVAARFLADPERRPTAIFAASDEMAIGAILAAREIGLRVPEDLSVVGIDDHELAPFFGLTTVAQYPGNQGARAVELLLSELGRDAAPSEDGEGNEPLGFDLVIRSTTAAPPA